MKRPARLLRILGAASLVASLLVGAFGTMSVSAQDPEQFPPIDSPGDLIDAIVPFFGGAGVYFPWVANDDTSTGLGPADTSITIQNLVPLEAQLVAYRGIGTEGLGGLNGWEPIGVFNLEGSASKTFSAAQLGIAEGEGAPVVVMGLMTLGFLDGGQFDDCFVGYSSSDMNGDGDVCDYETIADDDFMSGANSWINPGTQEPISWEDGDCLVVDINSGGQVTIRTPDSPGGANLDDNPADCTFSEADDYGLNDGPLVFPALLGGYAKQAVDGENLPNTSEAEDSVSGYNAISGWELIEVGNTDDPFFDDSEIPGEFPLPQQNDLQGDFSDVNFNGWYLPIVQTNGGPGGAWNSIIRIANFGDDEGTIGAAGVNVTIYPADNAAGELNQSFTFNKLVNAGETWSIDLSDEVPEGFIGSAHIAADAPIFAMVDRVKVGYSAWITNTASNALQTAYDDLLPQIFQQKYVLVAPDVRKDFFGWNTGINVANLADADNTVTIQYYGSNGVSAQTREIHAKGMTYFYDPSQAPQDNNQQDPVTDTTTNAGEIGAAMIIADYPVAATVDATKYPESTTEADPNVFQALSYSATSNVLFDQAVPLVQKGNPNTGMGATSGVQLFNVLDVSRSATIHWFNSSGDEVGNPTPVVVNPNAMTFVYTMNDAQLPMGFTGSAVVDVGGFADSGDLGELGDFLGGLYTVSTQVDYQVQFDGSAVWNGYSPLGNYRSFFPFPVILAILQAITGGTGGGVG